MENLIELAQAGDKEALGIILEKFEPMIKSISSKYFSAWADFEDFVQIGFVGLIQAVFNYKKDASSKFSTFAYLNISSEVKSFLTYLNRQKNKVLTEAISMENIYDDYNEDSDYFFEDPQEDRASFLLNYLIHDSITDMNDSEQDILKLWFKGFTYNEISDELNIKNKKVDNTIQKIKKILSDRKDLYENLLYFFGGMI